VLKLLVAGLSNKQIARQLDISPHGVKRLVSNVLAKLGCSNRTLAVALAITERILAD
jgi:DNA-binding CsgD family transcriptional regulator